MSKPVRNPEDNPFNDFKKATVKAEDLFSSNFDVKGANPFQGVTPKAETPTPEPEPSPEGMFDDIHTFEESPTPTAEDVPPTSHEVPKIEGMPKNAGGAYIKFTGVLVLIVIVVLGYRGFKSAGNKNKAELERFVKSNPTGGYIDRKGQGEIVSNTNTNTNTNTNEPEFDLYGDSTLKTVIGKYEKALGEDGRTLIVVNLDDYGEYKIYIPYLKYKDLDEKGYMLVDVELVNDKPSFLYMSSKQENLLDMLNN